METLELFQVIAMTSGEHTRPLTWKKTPRFSPSGKGIKTPRFSQSGKAIKTPRFSLSGKAIKTPRFSQSVKL